MKSNEAIEWARRVYPDVREITQLQLANAYMSGIMKGTSDAQESALNIISGIDYTGKATDQSRNADTQEINKYVEI